jgi:hypothetical protein
MIMTGSQDFAPRSAVRDQCRHREPRIDEILAEPIVKLLRQRVASMQSRSKAR